tara:strand:+ start:406 stop:675 length:270 start_codon:yes stop_codon:yes gene_type:complete
MDLLDSCFVCDTGIKEGDDVIVTDNAKVLEKADWESGSACVFETSDQEPYRGVYCPDCWLLMVRAQNSLKDQKRAERYEKQNKTPVQAS